MEDDDDLRRWGDRVAGILEREYIQYLRRVIMVYVPGEKRLAPIHACRSYRQHTDTIMTSIMITIMTLKMTAIMTPKMTFIMTPIRTAIMTPIMTSIMTLIRTAKMTVLHRLLFS